MDVTPKQVLSELKKIREHLEKLRQDRHEEIAAVNSAEESREKNRDIKPFWLDQVLTEYQESVTDKKTEAERHYRIQKSLKRATWLTFFATAAAFGAAAYYAHYARRTFIEIQAQTPFIEKAGNAAKSSSDTAADTLKASQQQFRNEQRPFLWLQPGIATKTQVMATITLEELKEQNLPLLVNLMATNGGHSPAINVINTKIVMIFEDGESATRKAKSYIPTYLSSTGIAVAPGTTIFLPHDAKDGPYALRVTDELIDDLKNDRKRIYFLGRVQYTDIFKPALKTPYETSICVIINPGGLPFSDCHAGMQSWIK